MIFYFRNSIQLIKGHKVWSLFLCLTLCAGLFALSFIGQVKYSIERDVEKNARKMAGADILISARRNFSLEEKKQIEEIFPTNFEGTWIYDFYSMISKTDGKSRLVQVRSIESVYPYYGEIKLDNEKSYGELEKKEFFSETPRMLVYPELLTQLELAIGDKVTLGEVDVEIWGVVRQDVSSFMRGVNLAPRIYLPQKHLEKTQLIQKGSTVRSRYFLKAPRDEDIPSAIERFKEIIDDTAITIKDFKSNGEDVSRLNRYLTDYLGLVALVGLCLSGIGVVLLLRNFFVTLFKILAIMQALGLSPRGLFIQGLMFCIVFISIASIMAFLLSLLGVYTLSSFDLPFNLQLDTQSIMFGFLEILLVGLGFGLSYSLPILRNLSEVKPQVLLQDTKESFSSLDLRKILLWMPALFITFLYAFVLVKSFLVAAGFLIVLFLFSFIVWVVAKGAQFLIFKRLELKKTSHYLFKKILIANKVLTNLHLICIGLCCFLIVLIPQIYFSIEEDLKYNSPEGRPSLFLFDIQEDQISDLRSLLDENSTKLSFESPMIRARVNKINGEELKRKDRKDYETREEEFNRRMNNRGVNLSFRKTLSDSENIIEGEWNGNIFQGKDKLPELSLEKRYARRLGLNLGDTMTFNILGVVIKGVVTSLRSVKWASFQPNFFIQFQPGVLDDAPKTYLGGLSLKGESEKANIQALIVDKFPNISIIDVERVIFNILKVANMILIALLSMAVTIFFMGILVIFSLNLFQMRERQKDFAMIKLLGGGWPLIRKVARMEFSYKSFLASFLGVLGGQLAAYAVCVAAFEGIWNPSYIFMFSVFVVTVILNLLVGELITSLSYKKKLVNFFS